MNIKSKILTVLVPIAMLLPVCASGQTSGKGIWLVGKDGAITVVPYASLDRIAIGAEGVAVSTLQGEVTSMDYSGLDKIIISADVSAIDKVVADAESAIWPTVTDGPLYVRSVSAARVAVYNTSGSLMMSQAVDPAEIATLSLSSFESGIYIVTLGDKSVKVIKK